MSIRLKDTIYDLINKASKDGSGNTITSTYLKLSGGTLTGPITINSVSTRLITLNSTAEGTTESGIRFDLEGVGKGWVGYQSTYGTYLYNNGKYLGVKSDGTPHYQGNILLHAANYTDYAATKDHTHSQYLTSLPTHTHSYLPLSGGTLSGPITFSGSDTLISLWEGQGKIGCDSTHGTWIQYGNENYIGVKTDGLYWKNSNIFYHSGNLSAVTTNTTQTITGFKTFSRSTYPGLIVNLSDTAGGESSIRFDVTNTGKGYAGYSSNWGMYIYNCTKFKYLGIKDDGTPYFDSYTILHTGNSSVSLSGSTLTVNIGGNSKSLTNTNTTYSAGTGISLSGTTFSNSGVREIGTGSSNGTISVNTNGTVTNVSIKGLGSAAYTNSSAYATASHTHSYLPLSGGTLSGANTPLGVNTTETSQIGIQFYINSTSKMWIGYEAAYGTVLYQYGTTPYRLGIDTSGTPYYGVSTTKYTLLHTGNYSSYLGTATRAKYLETIQDGNWWGDSYKMYANWETSTICKLTVDSYYTKTDYANNATYATSAGNADTVDSVHNGDLTAKYIKDIGNGTSITVQYSGSGITSAQWICAWSGYKISGIDQANINAGMVDGLHFSTVSSLPSSPNSSTVYFITG